MSSLLLAFGLVLIIEGIGPLLFPNKWRNYLQKLAQEKVSSIRQVGLVLVTIGVIILWFNA